MIFLKIVKELGILGLVDEAKIAENATPAKAMRLKDEFR